MGKKILIKVKLNQRRNGVVGVQHSHAGKLLASLQHTGMGGLLKPVIVRITAKLFNCLGFFYWFFILIM